MTPIEQADLMTAVADVIQDHIALALRDMTTQLAVAQSQIAGFTEREKAWTDVRDRLIVMEAKASIPAPLPKLIDLGPVLDRIASVEAKCGDFDLNIGTATKKFLTLNPPGFIPPKSDDSISAMDARLSAVELKIDMKAGETAPILTSLAELTKDFGAMRERVAVAEAKTVPVAPVDLTDRVAAVEAGLSSALLKIDLKSAETGPLMTSLADLVKDFGAIRERMAVVEVRGQVPGPAGKDGAPGKDGVDGLGFDELTTVQNDDRSFTVKAQRGDRVKDIGTARFPVQIQRGVYVEGKSYELGDLVTWGGSQWHADEPTSSKPGDGSKGWTLVVKRGRDGKDGKDAVSVPVVSVGRS